MFSLQVSSIDLWKFIYSIQKFIEVPSVSWTFFTKDLFGFLSATT